MNRENLIHLGVLVAAVVISLSASAACEVIDGAWHFPFDGKSLHELLIEKKSLTRLNREYPALNVIEKTFKGEAQTCTNCTEKYVACHE